MKKKGFLLIECAMYIWFCAIFSTMILTLFMPYIKEFKNEIKASTSYNYMLSASMYIENALLDSNIYSILVNSNEIKIYKDNGELELDTIKRKKISGNYKIVVEHSRVKSEQSSLDLNNETSNFYDDIDKYDDENYTKVATNTILKDVEVFNVVQNGNIINVYLKQYDSTERIFSYENKYVYKE